MVPGSKLNKINGKICRKQSEVLKTAKLKGVGAADKAAIQLVKVQLAGLVTGPGL
jgi:hypothetical protein